MKSIAKNFNDATRKEIVEKLKTHSGRSSFAEITAHASRLRIKAREYYIVSFNKLRQSPNLILKPKSGLGFLDTTESSQQRLMKRWTFRLQKINRAEKRMIERLIESQSRNLTREFNHRH